MGKAKQYQSDICRFRGRWQSMIMAMVLCVVLLARPADSRADSDYEFIFFGVHLNSLDESNWLVMAAGAFTSYMAHELGHVLYLTAEGKDWELQGPNSSGLSVYTSEDMTDSQWRNFGRAGFALQSGIGMMLTAFDTSRRWDFSKGWVMMNAMQMYSYNVREGDYNDFHLIDRGRGNGDMERHLFSAAASWGVMRIEEWDEQVVKHPNRIVQGLWQAPPEPKEIVLSVLDDRWPYGDEQQTASFTVQMHSLDFLPASPDQAVWDLPSLYETQIEPIVLVATVSADSIGAMYVNPVPSYGR